VSADRASTRAAGLKRKRNWTPARPCVGCGYCCLVARCATGQSYELITTGKVSGPACPYLTHNGARYRCAIADRLGEALAIGAGCSSPLNTERRRMLGEVE